MTHDSYGLRSPVRVAIADALALRREGLVGLLERCPQVIVVGATGQDSSVAEMCRTARPDALVLCSTIAGELPREHLDALRQDVPEVAIVLLADGDGEVRPCAAASLARGVVRNGDSLDTLLKAISGRQPQPDAARTDPRTFVRRRRTRLSPRETEVATLIADGLANRAIAQRLTLTEQSVKNVVSRILKKLGLTNRVQIAMRTWVDTKSI